MRPPLEFFAEPPPGVSAGSLRGKLVALEGPAAVGRSTQVALLRESLENEGYAVRVWQAFPLQPHGVSGAASALRELASFAATLESEILPALREAFFVVADGYIFSWITRMQSRGLSGEWLRHLIGFALAPHAALYLRSEPKVLAARAANRGFGEQESAIDLRLGADLCDSFLKYQERVIAALDSLTDVYNLTVIDASESPDRVFRRVLREVRKL